MSKNSLNSHFKGNAYNEKNTKTYIEEIISQLDLINRAYSKLGFNADYFNEYTTVNFIGFEYGELSKQKAQIKVFKDGRSVSNLIHSTYLFFGKRQMYIYNYVFSTDLKYRTENLVEIFYREIIAIGVRGGSVGGEDAEKNKFNVSNNYMSISYGAEKIEFPIMPDIDMNNETIFNFRKLIRDKKFLG